MNIHNEGHEIRLAFVRHAMSVDNEAWRFGLPWPGIADAPLCSRGREMLSSITAVLGEWRPDLIVTSPLRRCIDTATPVANATEARIEVDYGLTEVSHNDGDLPPPPEVLAKVRPDLIVNGQHAICYWEQPAQARAMRVICELASRPERKICLVGHRGWLLALAGLDIENGEVICLKVEFAVGDSATNSEMTITRIPRMW
jgi:broad specificity phosphatase PhoE